MRNAREPLGWHPTVQLGDQQKVTDLDAAHRAIKSFWWHGSNIQN
jgi:hypothetical protein